VVFAVDGSVMILLHGFVKKSQKTPAAASRRLGSVWPGLKGSDVMKKQHLGGDFDDFLRDEHVLDDAEATAAKRVIAFQIAQEMKRARLTKSEMAHRMKTSRPAVDRLLDPKNRSVTLSTLERAASAVGKKLTIELT